MHPLFRTLPAGLVWGRLGLGAGALGLCQLPPTPALRFWVAGLLLTGLLTDVLDGILARRWGVATATLRRLDSSVDLVFWLCLLAGILRWAPGFLAAHASLIGGVVALELLTYAVSFGRFRKEIALHTLLAKGWTLLLAALLVQLCLTGASGWFFQVCAYIGIVSRLEIVAILLTLPTWTTDVPSWWHALRLRQGWHIRRNPLFN